MASIESLVRRQKPVAQFVISAQISELTPQELMASPRSGFRMADQGLMSLGFPMDL
jgi:hypothetical protein